MYEPSRPILTHLLAQEWADKPDKPTARGTRLRYSSAHDCARKMGYLAIGAQQTDPMDAGDAWAPGLGTLIHEASQAAIARRYPYARFEVSSQLGEVSGSLDCLVSTDDVRSKTGENLGGTHVLWELKSMGEFAFDKQVGWSRMKSAFKTPAGPSIKAITQAGVNAIGIEKEYDGIRIETILMGSVCISVLSKRKAKAMRMRGFERLGAEYRVGRDVWYDLALFEMGRMEGILADIEGGFLPARIAIDDNNREEELNPMGDNWNCDYCPFVSRCLADGVNAMVPE